jgi:hypothetical protein
MATPVVTTAIVGQSRRVTTTYLATPPNPNPIFSGAQLFNKYIGFAKVIVTVVGAATDEFSFCVIGGQFNDFTSPRAIIAFVKGSEDRCTYVSVGAAPWFNPKVNTVVDDPAANTGPRIVVQSNTLGYKMNFSYNAPPISGSTQPTQTVQMDTDLGNVDISIRYESVYPPAFCLYLYGQF